MRILLLLAVATAGVGCTSSGVPADSLNTKDKKVGNFVYGMPNGKTPPKTGPKTGN